MNDWMLCFVRAFVFQAAPRRSRQAFEAEPVEGVWSPWGEWSECSQTCGVGVSQRTRKCLAPPPPPPQTRPFSPPNWAGYVPGRSATSPVSPYYHSRYPGQHPSYHSPSVSANNNAGLPLYVNSPAAPGQPARSPPFYHPEFPSANQDAASSYRSPYYVPSQGYNQPPRVFRRPPNPGAERAGAGGSRRSVPTNREVSTSRR